MVHLTEKPVELARRAMEYSSRPGENVLDLFGGSGSTLIAAEQTGRRAFLMELDPLYADVIVQRWEQFMGRKAERIAADGRVLSLPPNPPDAAGERCSGQGVDEPLVASDQAAIAIDGQGEVETVVDRAAGCDGQVEGGSNERASGGDLKRHSEEVLNDRGGLVGCDFPSSASLPHDVAELGHDQVGGEQCVST